MCRAPSALALPLLAKDDGLDRKGEELLERLLERVGGSGGRRIRCPKCRWEPRQTARWMCRCGHCWNTFDTAGLCPACGYQWEITACLRCGEYSPHRDWYEDEPGEGGAA